MASEATELTEATQPLPASFLFEAESVRICLAF